MIKPQGGLKRSLKAAISHARRARFNGEPTEQLPSWRALILLARAKARVCTPDKKPKLVRLAIQLEDEITLATQL